MNIRKFFNLPTKAQQVLLDENTTIILKKCNAISTAEYRDQKEAQKTHDNICPNCRAKKEDIVDKIRNVHGKGSVSGSFNLGFGSVSGSFGVDTDGVNHCNKCGNEWKKFVIKYTSDDDILRTTLRYLVDIIEDPENKKFSWKVEAIKVFDDSYAETIYRLSQNQTRYFTKRNLDVLNINALRCYYKSVFDAENKKKLENL